MLTELDKAGRNILIRENQQLRKENERLLFIISDLKAYRKERDKQVRMHTYLAIKARYDGKKYKCPSCKKVIFKDRIITSTHCPECYSSFIIVDGEFKCKF